MILTSVASIIIIFSLLNIWLLLSLSIYEDGNYIQYEYIGWNWGQWRIRISLVGWTSFLLVHVIFFLSFPHCCSAVWPRSSVVIEIVNLMSILFIELDDDSLMTNDRPICRGEQIINDLDERPCFRGRDSWTTMGNEERRRWHELENDVHPTRRS